MVLGDTFLACILYKLKYPNLTSRQISYASFCSVKYIKIIIFGWSLFKILVTIKYKLFELSSPLIYVIIPLIHYYRNYIAIYIFRMVTFFTPLICM